MCPAEALAQGEFWQRDNEAAWQLYRNSKSIQAEQLLRSAVREAEGFPQPAWQLENSLARLGWVLLDLDRTEQSRQVAARGWHLGPQLKNGRGQLPRVQIQLLLAGTSAKNGQMDAALKHFAQVESLTQAVQADRPLGLVLHWVSQALEKQQQWARARVAARQAFDMLNEHGRPHDVMHAASDLARLHFLSGAFAEARSMYDEHWSKAVDAAKIDDGREHSLYLSRVFLEKRLLHQRLGEYHLARINLQRAEFQLKPFVSNLETFPAVNARAKFAIELRQLDDAAPVVAWLELASRHRKARPEYGEAAQQTLGLYKLQQNDFAGARTQFRAAWEARRKRLGVEHPDLVHLLQELSRAELGLGNWRAALARAHEGRQLVAGAFGGLHPDVAVFLRLEAQAMLAAGRHVPAIARTDDAFRIHDFAFGATSHPDVIETSAVRAEANWFAGEKAAAEQDTDAAIKDYPQAIEVHQPVLAQLHSLRARILHTNGDVRNALASYQKSLSLWQSIHSSPAPAGKETAKDNPQKARTLLGLAAAMVAAGDTAKADTIYADAERILFQSRRPVVIAFELNRWGNAFWNYRRYAEAAWFYGHASQLYEKAHGAEHPFTRQTKDNRQRALEQWHASRARSNNSR